MGYDVIGDIHGQADKLDALLARLGDRHSVDGWRHPGRIEVFVGARGLRRLLGRQRGPLVAYCWDGESVLTDRHFVSVG